MATIFRRFKQNSTADEGNRDESITATGTSKESPTILQTEKHDPEVAVSRDGAVQDEPEDLEEDVRAIPLAVRRIVSLEDDTTLSTITFRYFVLTFIFTAPGALLYQMGYYRTTAAPYSVLFVLICCHYAGIWLAKILPAWKIRVPFTNFGFSMNPGPWSIKEHVLVTVSAASGATANAAWVPISLAKLYYGEDINTAACLFFMWSVVYIGYGMAAIARQFLIYDPIYTWPYALMETSLFETFKKSAQDSRVGRKQKFVFFAVLIGATLWEFLPEYVFPFVSSLSFLCWVAPENAVANFIGGGIGGMGFLNLSLDWSNISNNLSNPMISPFWTSAVLFAAYVLNCWVLLPAAKWGSLGAYKHNLMSNRLFLANGSSYPVTALLGPNNTFNETAYQKYGPVYMGTQQVWGMFFDYSSYISALTWMALFGFTKIRENFRTLVKRAKSRGSESINYSYTDRLNVIQRSYKEVPLWWYIALFAVSFITIITILAKGLFFIPVWTFFVAIGTSGFMILPFSWLYSFSNFQVEIGTFNELIYGYMVHAGSGHRHPAGSSTYGAIAGDIWYRAQYMLQDQKIGHYMHVPPRDIFFSQIFGELIGVPINYAIIQWVIHAKRPYLLGEKQDPLNQWTGQSLSGYNTLAVQYVLVGPGRLFKEHIYKPLPWSFLFGAGAPLVLYLLHRAFPRAKFNLWNVTVFASGMCQFYGNLSTGYISRFIVGYISMRYFYRKRFETWRRYNFPIAAALDTAFNAAMLLIFIFFSSGKVISMPNWWGNNAKSVERCFALDSS
ncbi:OPT superfamily oligopeptide transporter [Glonium stellatum]|uniref:OPT superfamily oligopeptide transporter n=1 Tax=Glonium stellatum TaxID=574774 RepID=A0A8E2JWV7_9PEZI|nr:OPT superfamily oligopeptide transporter [Glonium stellatum]